jgi:hypothetical protein
MADFWAAEVVSGVPRYLVVIVVFALSALGFFFIRQRKTAAQPVEMRQLPGSRVALAVSERFQPSDRFNGYVHDGSGSSIIALELPVSAFEQFQDASKAARTFAAQGVTGIAEHPLPARSGKFVFLVGDQKTSLVDYVKYILVFLDRGVTGMVTANIPRAALATGLMTSAEIEAILASAEIRQDVPKTPELFSLGYLGEFEEDTSLLGTTKAYRLKPGAEATTLHQPAPLFLVAASLAQAPIPDLGLYAEKTFLAMDQLEDKLVEQQNPLKQAKLNAVELIGTGTDVVSRQKAFVYQMIVEADAGGFYRLVGLAAEADRTTLLPEFQKIAASFRV